MSIRPIRRFAGTLLVGAFAAYLVVSDVVFMRRAVEGIATVSGSTNGGVGATPGRSGRTFADALIFVDGRPVDATLRAWYQFFEPGANVSVLYLPSAPNALVPNEFWQLHFASMIGVALCLVVGAAEWWKSRAEVHRPARSLLRGD